MSITPRGMSVQEAYRLFRDGKLLVNRRYQRKLVWTEPEKRRLIDSIMKNIPIPLILLAEQKAQPESGVYEIIDGVQRLNAIYSFIENDFDWNDKYFDISENARAKQLSDQGIFNPAPTEAYRLSRTECANILDYQLAVTIYPTSDESETTEIFGRINSGGKQLSDQEKRQAGVISKFAEFVRTLSADVRGDTSQEILKLYDMPEISIESKRTKLGYGLVADDIFWCKQGILSISGLRDSEDEEIIVDVIASILFDTPIARSRELLDKIYDNLSEEHARIERSLYSYPFEKLYDEVKKVLSILRETIEEASNTPKYFRRTINPRSSNPIKNSFYTVFMAFFHLIVKEGKSPTDSSAIMNSLKDLQSKLKISSHYANSDDRIQNINLTKGLIQDHFVKAVPSILFGHGPSLAIDFENSLRRSSIETPRYEFKQGILRLSTDRTLDADLLLRIIETCSAIANVGPNQEGYLFIGVADKEADAKRVSSLDKITPIQIGNRFVVGIDREATILNISIDQYADRLVGEIRNSGLSDPLKQQVLTSIDTIQYKTMNVIRIRIPKQTSASFVGDDLYFRDGSSTIKATSKDTAAIAGLFK